MRELEIKVKVEKKLLEDRNKIKKQIEILKEEDELIDKHLGINTHEMNLLRQNIEMVNEKHLLIQQTLETLMVERDKALLLGRK